MAAGRGGALTAGDAAGTLAAAEAARGEVIFKKCYACHAVLPGETGLAGPDLSGAVAGARRLQHSDALEALPRQGNGRWTDAALDALIGSPEDRAPGTTMAVVGMRALGERTAPNAYLARTGAGSGEE